MRALDMDGNRLGEVGRVQGVGYSVYLLYWYKSTDTGRDRMIAVIMLYVVCVCVCNGFLILLR